MIATQLITKFNRDAQKQWSLLDTLSVSHDCWYMEGENSPERDHRGKWVGDRIIWKHSMGASDITEGGQRMDSLKAHWDPGRGGGGALGDGNRPWTEGNGQGWADLSISTAQNCLTHVITFPNLVPGRDNYQQPKEQVNILRVNTAHPWLCNAHPIYFSTLCSGREEVVENSTSPHLRYTPTPWDVFSWGRKVKRPPFNLRRGPRERNHDLMSSIPI